MQLGPLVSLDLALGFATRLTSVQVIYFIQTGDSASYN